MKLYNYFRSSAAYRVRIALNLKGIAYDPIAVHLVKREHRTPEFLALNPAGLVPALTTDDGAVLTQSLAIIEYLEEAHPATARILPADALARAHVRSLALALACDVHPLCNVRVLNYLTNDLSVAPSAKDQWIVHWISTGLDAFEKTLAQSGTSGTFCFGDTPTLADIVLVPQMFSARRFGVDMAAYPLISAIDASCNALTAFADAAPARQPDFQA
ncbi:MAG: maleylacetoacetate isomerase [Casimicrobium sp.]